MKTTMHDHKLCRIALIAITFLFTVSILCACQTSGNPTTPTAENETYTVSLTTESGPPLSKVDVFVYTDATLADLVTVGKTDAAGNATFTAPLAQGYAVTLKGVPAGYPLEESYAVTGTTTEIVLAAKLIENPDLSKDKFRLNSVMFDFTVTDTQGNSHTLSELLQQKKAVVLNFWFAQCGPCKAEFPFMQEAFEKYSDDIALLALNPIDDAATVAQYRAAQGLTIPMASVDAAWAKAFDMIYFPTTMIIDRYGNINLMHIGSVDNIELFEKVFEYYTSEDYTQQIGLKMEEFASK